MKIELLAALDQLFSESPAMRADDLPTEDEIDVASQKLNVPFPQDYREFLKRYGGAMVGPYPVFGLRPVEVMEKERWSVVKITEAIRYELANNLRWVIFSEDHSGNPIGFDATGSVLIFDHDFGGETKIADSFESYIRLQCLKLKH
ncbi:SMI1/KNR4 family protein [Stieleria sp. TO1_6]|uniref:SMI1/KNR4 family protein n=1 Tax=Stieleria tagensis TaxID=2956795 RepID=UPI00209A8ED7|nr:SMI1/KNR4 family protein [Stieleria tagensis]MCO8120271.1 SMI1/KNR4 family protein [Stieleria tagensis]